MQPSSSTRGPTRVTILPEVGREEMLETWGLSTSHHWHELEERGWELGEDPTERELEELGFVADGGWSTVDISRGSDGDVHGARDLGMSAHRGVLHPDEYVDYEALRPMVEREIGFTYEQVRSVYRQGKLSDDQRELRGQIDARLLALSRAGGNMAELGRVLGLSAHGDRMCWVIRKALTRAEAQS